MSIRLCPPRVRGMDSRGGGEEASSVATFRDMQTMDAALEPMRRAELLQKQVDDQLRQRAVGSPTQVGQLTIVTPDQAGREVMNSSTPIGVSAPAKEVVVPPLPMPPPGYTLGDGSRRNTPRPPLSGEPGVKQLADRLSEEMAVRQREGQEARQVLQLPASEVQDARQRAAVADQQLAAIQ